MSLGAPVVPLLIIPLVICASHGLAASFAPGTALQWAHWPGWAMFLTFVLPDDLTHYA